MKKELLILSILLVTLAGCNSQATPPSETNHNGMNMQQVKPQSTANHDHIADNADDVNKVNNREDTASYLEHLAKGIDGVNDAHVVLIGKTAVVGIDVDPSLERSRVGTIKYSVAEALSKDPYGVNAIVTADLDLRQRIAEISEDISAGRPVQGVIEELSDIVGRIVPQIPADLMPAAKENTIESNNLKNKNDNKGKYAKPEDIINEHEQKIKAK